MSNADEIFERTMALMKSRCFKKAEFAKLIGVPPQSLTNWKTRGVPHEKLFDIALVLNVNAEELRYGEIKHPPKSDYTLRKAMDLISGMSEENKIIAMSYLVYLKEKSDKEASPAVE